MVLLPLENLRRIIGYNPWHFWGLSDNTVPVTSCAGIVYQYAWQGQDAVGREGLLYATERAEDMLQGYLGYDVAPRYVEETYPWPRYLDPGLIRAYPMGADGRWLPLQLRRGYVQAVGSESLTLIGNASLSYSDEDNDGLDESWALTIATTVADANRLAVYFIPADRLDDEPVGDAWRVQPVRVSISGGTATVRGKRWQVVRPIRYQGIAVDGLDPADNANFVTLLAVYERRTDSSDQATLTWETRPCPWWCDTANNSTDPASIATATARVGIRDSRLGIVAPAEAVYNSSTDTWSSPSCLTDNGGREPDRVTVRYLAGYPLEDQQMARTWQYAVVALALAELPSPLCGCEDANKVVYYYQFDLARSSGANDEAYGGTPIGDLENPFGTRRGHVQAWKRIKPNRRTIGMAMG